MAFQDLNRNWIDNVADKAKAETYERKKKT